MNFSWIEILDGILHLAFSTLIPWLIKFHKTDSCAYMAMRSSVIENETNVAVQRLRISRNKCVENLGCGFLLADRVEPWDRNSENNGHGRTAVHQRRERIELLAQIFQVFLATNEFHFWKWRFSVGALPIILRAFFIEGEFICERMLCVNNNVMAMLRACCMFDAIVAYMWLVAESYDGDLNQR